MPCSCKACDAPRVIPPTDRKTADWVACHAIEAKKAMRLQVDNPSRRFLISAVANLRDLRAPVTCVGCGTVYEGSLMACPSCADKIAVGPTTELSIQIARLRAGKIPALVVPATAPAAKILHLVRLPVKRSRKRVGMGK